MAETDSQTKTFHPRFQSFGTSREFADCCVGQYRCWSRTGFLQGSVATPTFVVPAAGGLTRHIVPQLMRSSLLEIGASSMSLGQIFPQRELLSKYLTSKQKMTNDGKLQSAVSYVEGCNASNITKVSQPGGIENVEPSDFFDASHFLTHLGCRDVMRGTDTSVLHHTCENDIPCFLLESVSGRQKISVPTHVEAIKSVRPAMVSSLAEEVACDPSAGRKKIRRSVESAHKSLTLLQRIMDSEWTAKSLGIRPLILANIQGGNDLHWRKVAVQNCCNAHPDGYSIGGLGYCEDLGVRADVLNSIASELSAESDKPRLLPLANGHPVEILQAIWMGVDLIEVAFPLRFAEMGVALLFEFEMPHCDHSTAPDCEDKKGDEMNFRKNYFWAEYPPLPSNISFPQVEQNKWSKKKVESAVTPIRTDTNPSSNIQVNLPHANYWEEKYSCALDPIGGHSPAAQYSPAYIHHLLKSGEMLSKIILTLHNIYMYCGLFAESRKHIASNSFSRYANWFCRTNVFVYKE